MIGPLTNLTLYVHDQAEAERWYREVLGFVLRERVPFTWPGAEEEGLWITIAPDEASRVVIALAPALSPQERLLVGAMPPMTFETDDAEALYVRLAGLGATLDGPPVRYPWGVSVVVRDPSGNALNLLEPAPR